MVVRGRRQRWPEAYEHANARCEKAAGKGKRVPACVLPMFLRERLGVPFAEWAGRRFDYGEVMRELAYQDGVALAEWVAENPAQMGESGEA